MRGTAYCIAQEVILTAARTGGARMAKALVVFSVAVAALFFVSAALPADQPGVKGFGASLAPRGEVPKSKAPADAAGLFSAIVTSDGSTSTIAWTLDYSGLSGRASAAHIHIGAPGKAGPVAIPLCGPCTSGSRGEIKLNAKTEKALASGGAYVNVHTKANPGGEIRGQIAPAHAVTAALGSTGEVPAATNVPAGAAGVFHAVIIDLPARPVIAWTLDFEGLSGDAAAAHIHVGKAGVAGGVALPLCQPCTSGVHGRRWIRQGLADAIVAGGTYVNIHTAANQAGEVRGQTAHATLGVAVRSTSLGVVVTDDRGMSLYLFEKDQGTQSACYGQCAVFWPPAYTVGTPVAGTGTKSSLLRVARRSDGSTMLTYAGKPLYGFLPDTQPGDTKGEGSKGFGAPWHVVGPATGNKVGG
jgi:predicted lipoprotein with Yx(FWY)xxD motif